MIKSNSSLASASEAVAFTAGVYNAPTRETVLYVGTGGDIVVKLKKDGEAVTFTNIQSGTYHLWDIASITEAGTTASDMIILT